MVKISEILVLVRVIIAALITAVMFAIAAFALVWQRPRFSLLLMCVYMAPLILIWIGARRYRKLEICGWFFLFILVVGVLSL